MDKNVELQNKLNKVINKLSDSDNLDEYDVNDLFSKAINLLKPKNVDCDLLVLNDFNIQEGKSYCDELEYDIGKIPEKDIDNDSPKAVDKENMLAFVENNFLYHGLDWYVTDVDETKVDFLDSKTAIKAINALKKTAYVFN